MASAVAKTYMQFAATTVGRDKTYRFVQYLCRFLAYYAARNGTAPKALLQALTSLKASIGLSRKLMRIGKPIDFYYGALQAFKATPDELLRVLTTGKQAFMALYMCFDTLQWVHGVKAYQFKNHAGIVRTGARFWLAALTCSWLAGVYQLYQNRMRYSTLSSKVSKLTEKYNSTDEVLLEKQSVSSQRQQITRQLIQDSLDILIPAHTLQYHSLGEGLVGLAG
ncbi:Peroxisomal membrane protein PMP27 [Dimargaris verticillata]|uniref:Peroxisomal membrane protein PMP27 n=1 Tax=Dimargaris verticillata TaxID=2761393 RepID=A0A9W8AWV6_9FUNG|nr:Peroxisomal membrane protein PMP27 [Dimargaris verticillata]